MAKNKESAKVLIEESFYSSFAKSIGGDILDNFDKTKGLIDTGILSLNYAVSGKFVGGGIPIGICAEIYGGSSSGKTLLGTNILRGVQTAGGIAILLDAERTINKQFAVKASHVDPKKFIVVSADTLEGCFNLIFKIIRQARNEANIPMEKPIVIVYDSIAASPSEREFAEADLDMETASKTEIKEAGAGADKPGERAKTCSKSLRILTPYLSEHNASVVFLNQVRNKIGVMFGCFSYNSKVLLSDGSWMKIGKIVNQKIPVEVVSYNQETGKVEPKKVVAWHKNGKLVEGESFLKIRFRRRFDVANGSMMVTPNHKLFVKNGAEVKEMSAGDIKEGDTLCVVQPHYLSDDHWQVVYGGLLGDSSLRCRESTNGELRLGHGLEQKDYLKYKLGIFGKLAGGISVKITPNTRCNSGKAYGGVRALYELRRLVSYKPSVHEENYIIPPEIADNLNELGLSIWYLDDGSYSGHYDKWGNGKSNICCKKFKNREIMFPAFERLGLSPTLHDVGFIFNADDTMKLHNMICRFVPPSMEYKIHPKFRGLFDYEVPLLNERYETIEGEVLSVERWKADSEHFRLKYDLTVEGNSTYVVGGAVVHNSPETTAAGGMALPFYCSTRMKMSSSKVIKDENGKVIGTNVKISNVKNKISVPFINIENLRLFYNSGIDPLGGLLEILKQAGRIESPSAGTYLVKEPWSGGLEVKFKSSKERGDVPAEVLLKCPALVDADKADQVQYYINMFGEALEAVEHGIGSEEDVGGEDE